MHGRKAPPSIHFRRAPHRSVATRQKARLDEQHCGACLPATSPPRPKNGWHATQQGFLYQCGRARPAHAIAQGHPIGREPAEGTSPRAAGADRTLRLLPQAAAVPTVRPLPPPLLPPHLSARAPHRSVATRQRLAWTSSIAVPPPSVPNTPATPTTHNKAGGQKSRLSAAFCSGRTSQAAQPVPIPVSAAPCSRRAPILRTAADRPHAAEDTHLSPPNAPRRRMPRKRAIKGRDSAHGATLKKSSSFHHQDILLRQERRRPTTSGDGRLSTQKDIHNI